MGCPAWQKALQAVQSTGRDSLYQSEGALYHVNQAD
jgi:hypothetical protein